MTIQDVYEVLTDTRVARCKIQTKLETLTPEQKADQDLVDVLRLAEDAIDSITKMITNTSLDGLPSIHGQHPFR